MSETQTTFQKDPTLREGESDARVTDLTEAKRQAEKVDKAESERAKLRIKLDLAASALHISRRKGPEAAEDYLGEKVHDATEMTSNPTKEGFNKVELNKRDAAREVRTQFRKVESRTNVANGDVTLPYGNEEPGSTKEDVVREVVADFKEADEDVDTAYKQLEDPAYRNDRPLPELDEEFGLEPGTLKLVK